MFQDPVASWVGLLVGAPASDEPASTWAIIATAVAGLGFGTLAGAVITRRGELDKQLHERMLGVADDFLKATAPARARLEQAGPTDDRAPLTDRLLMRGSPWVSSHYP